GRPLAVTVRNFADELAAAADLVKGKASGVPSALGRGVPGATAGGGPARGRARAGPGDRVRRPSRASGSVAPGLTPAPAAGARGPPEPAQERIARALEVAAVPRDGRPSARARARLSTEADGSAHIVVETVDGSRQSLIDAATLAERIRTAL